MKKKKLFIATSSFDYLDNKKLKILQKKNISITLNEKKRKLKKDELIRYAQDSNIIIAGTELYDEYVLKKLPKLNLLFRLGAGDENINKNELKKRNIKFFKSKITPEKAVAELIIGMIISLQRKIMEHNNNMKLGIWKKKMGNLLYKKKVGIIGYGKVGKELSKLLKSFETTNYIFDIKKNFKKKTKTNLNYLLKNSDIISLNANIKNDNQILNKTKLRLLKKEAVIINTARPELIDNEHVYRMIEKNKIAGVALDVYDKEPYKGKFLSSKKNVLLTPHIGSYAKEIRFEMEKEAIENLLNFKWK